ncbi:MAG: anthranilate synthase component I family protein [Bacteroidota bacterium]
MLKKTTHTISESNFNVNIEILNRYFERICVFDSNAQANKNQHTQNDKTIAIGATQELTIKNSQNALEELQEFYDKKKGWLFGYLTYDLKNQTEQLSSENDDGLQFPLLHFFIPKIVIQIKKNSAIIFYDDDVITKEEADNIYNLCSTPPTPLSMGESHVPAPFKNEQQKIIIKSKISKPDYINAVNQLKQHIHKGNIYEVNFCQEYFAENTTINTAAIYTKLNTISQAPFSAYCKFGSQYVMCASPERFLQKRANHLISQPIKGTAKRSANSEEDEQLKQELKNNPKEQSENVMIVDLVRNDLSRIAKRGSVNVDELFGIYSFKQVHQMISTISCDLKEDVSFTEIIRNTFPMGSMTGAPKISAMKLIEKFESTKRGLYSGAIGYIDPNGDFDFNVVIRSILYNEDNKYVSFMVGSAITDKSVAENEYDECLLKAKAMFEVLEN